MKTLNLHRPDKTEVKYKAFFMPDGQPHIQLQEEPEEPVRVICSLTSMDSVGLLLVALSSLDALKGPFSMVKCLDIYYMLGARQDRFFKNEAFTLGVMADIINHHIDRNTKVRVLHPHSESTGKQFGSRFEEIGPWNYFEVAMEKFKPDCIVLPDKGVLQHLEKIEFYGKPVIKGDKARDPKTGKLSGFKLLEDSEMPWGRCLFFDDICDGGGTFCGLASISEFSECDLGLYTTHGIYSKGFDGLNEHFENLYCTDSYFSGPCVEDWDSCRVTVIEI